MKTIIYFKKIHIHKFAWLLKWYKVGNKQNRIMNIIYYFGFKKYVHLWKIISSN